MKTRKLSLYEIGIIAVCVTAIIASVGFYCKTSLLPVRSTEFGEIEEVIDKFQTCYSNQDINGLREVFFADAVIAWDGSQGSRQTVIGVDEWLQDTKEYVFDENDHISDVLSNRDVTVLRNIAYAVCDYNYTSDTKKGAGVDVLTLCKMRGNWKIVSLQWTGDEELK